MSLQHDHCITFQGVRFLRIRPYESKLPMEHTQKHDSTIKIRQTHTMKETQHMSEPTQAANTSRRYVTTKAINCRGDFLQIIK